MYKTIKNELGRQNLFKVFETISQRYSNTAKLLLPYQKKLIKFNPADLPQSLFYDTSQQSFCMVLDLQSSRIFPQTVKGLK